MIGRLRRPRDPFWGDGRGARQTQRRLRLEGLVALSLAIVACGVTAAMWLRTLTPLVDRIGLR
ncbi:MAG: hypothetical protein A2Z32_06815 [Chloroflexi bacterium RBG_16_69_14]|nr:MAG: hypothetical protein A2Z32_06815 [Chloroflexi bacterium RBG_16_69_14]